MVAVSLSRRSQMRSFWPGNPYTCTQILHCTGPADCCCILRCCLSVSASSELQGAEELRGLAQIFGGEICIGIPPR